MGLLCVVLLDNNVVLFQDSKCPTAKCRTELKSQTLMLGSRLDKLYCDLDLVRRPLRLHRSVLCLSRPFMPDQLAANIYMVKRCKCFAREGKAALLGLQGNFCLAAALTDHVERMKVPCNSKISFTITCDCKSF